MYKVLLATKNKDKARIVTSLLRDILTHVDVSTFHDIHFEVEEEEEGNLLERARQKTHLFLKNRKDGQDFDLLIGIDDGIGVAREEPNVDSRMMTERILREEGIGKGDIVVIARAFHMVNLETQASASCLTRVPFIFLGNGAGIRWGDVPYPLGYVVSTQEDTVPVVEMDQEQAHEHTKKYSLLFLEEALRTVL